MLFFEEISPFLIGTVKQFDNVFFHFEEVVLIVTLLENLLCIKIILNIKKNLCLRNTFIESKLNIYLKYCTHTSKYLNKNI